jgi:hypothetical protein
VDHEQGVPRSTPSMAGSVARSYNRLQGDLPKSLALAQRNHDAKSKVLVACYPSPSRRSSGAPTVSAVPSAHAAPRMRQGDDRRRVELITNSREACGKRAVIAQRRRLQSARPIGFERLVACSHSAAARTYRIECSCWPNATLNRRSWLQETLLPLMRMRHPE